MDESDDEEFLGAVAGVDDERLGEQHANSHRKVYVDCPGFVGDHQWCGHDVQLWIGKEQDSKYVVKDNPYLNVIDV
jgi:hypothetical protein